MSDGFLFLEGWEGDASALAWEEIDPTPAVIDADWARTGGKGIGGTGFRAESPLWEPTTSLNMGFAFRCGAQPTGNNRLLEIHSPGDRFWLWFGVSAQRTFWVRLAQDGLGMPGSEGDHYSTYQFDVGAWVYLEFNLTANGAGNLFSLQANGPAGTPGATGAEILTATSAAPGTNVYNEYNQIHLIGSPSVDFSVDDIYVRDGTVGGWVGDTQIVMLDLEDDRATDFTRLSGAKNYLMVNEADPDEDTTYNETAADGEDLFEVGDEVFTGTIHAVQLCARARKTDTDTWTLETTLDLAAVRAYGTPRYLGQAYETVPPDVYGDAPGETGWTLQQLNDIGVGYRATNVV